MNNSWRLSIALIALAASPVARTAVRQPFLSPTSQEWFNDCIAKGGGKYTCATESVFYDPLGTDVTGFTLQIQYDPTIRTFDPTLSGPLGVFSVGGDAPPPNAGVGTQPIQLLPSSGYSAGAPLAGSTLSYTNVAGLLTVSYDLGQSISMTTDVNFFRLTFDLVNPVTIDLASSTVTYSATGPGADFTQVAFSCTTPDPGGMCASNNPSTGITVNYSSGTTPEPNAAPIAALLLTAGALHRRRSFRRRLKS